MSNQEFTHHISARNGSTVSVKTTSATALMPADLSAILKEASKKSGAKLRGGDLEIVTTKGVVTVRAKTAYSASDAARTLEAASDLIAAANPDCWLDIWESENMGGTGQRVWGPAAYPSLGGWGDEIDSLKTGPACWAVLWEDEGFEDKHLPIYPNTYISNLDVYGFGDETDSMKLYEHQSQYHP